ncbi:hypothetical protein B0T26DRAFT_750755 [Lasiosphaeria miniovina]|uniref:FAD-binding domain-containing protein n=1 Tax=Lasiosphaeria miniovina TaxID=1954250 RepID=A0AA40AWW5_9PEZI|nr:uncharacterized protein B0T26DRAFT_750755 [Lasiosphaeria miniovina]KAK0723491.1 hypothetical protein B0T26DRAFT_750755 [Lasiosphaeria miniovina]
MQHSQAWLPRIAIVGAGNGFEVVVYEKEKYLNERVREWTMLIHWALPTLLKLLPDHIIGNLRSAYVDQWYPYDQEKEFLPYYNGMSGELAFKGKQLADLQVPNSAGPVAIRFGDGDSTTADVVFGADGSNSRTRRWLLGDEASKTLDSEHIIASGILKYETAEQAVAVKMGYPLCTIAPVNDGVIFTRSVPDPNDPVNWSFHVARVWKGKTDFLEGAAAIAKAKAMTTDPNISEPFRSAIHLIPDNANFTVTQLRYWETVPWDNKGGRVTLLGDAAHCVLPGRGQGLNHALGDVDALVSEFLRVKENGSTVIEALQTYKADVFVRGPKAVRESLEDTEAIMKVRNLEKSRQAQKGMAL